MKTLIVLILILTGCNTNKSTTSETSMFMVVEDCTEPIMTIDANGKMTITGDTLHVVEALIDALKKQR